jgi:cytochrome c oxidase subunit II
MTLYLLFAGVGILIYTGVAVAEAAVSGFSGARVGDASIPAEASIILPNGSRAAVAVSESAGALAGRTLFQERGCIGCHRSDGTGDGPTLHGLFGSPVQDPACGVVFVDESYLSEAILNPSATVAVGFPPIMPTFASQLTEEELQALIVYLKSLSALVQVQSR